MILRRYNIRDGAKTTSGGTVRASVRCRTLNGVALALEGDPVHCSTCGKQGVIRCDGPRLPQRFNGKEYALHDDLCICECHPPPRLIAEQTVVCQLIAVTDAPAGESLAREAAPKATHPAYDEQPRLVAAPIEGLPFHIETKDGRKFVGRTGPGGLLPRVATQDKDTYTVYWGDEALAKAGGIEA